VYYKSAKDRIGVIRMKAADLSLYSHPISVHSKEVQVTFSVNFSEVLEDENFCLDYSLDGGSSWQEQKCWIVADNFESDVWYSTSEVFPSNGAEKLIFRFRGSATYLLDQVQIFGSDS
jgi:trypsin